MKELQQCYTRAFTRITELERQNALLKEQIDLYAQDLSAEFKNYVILEKDTYENLKECLCEAYAKFEALKQEGSSLQTRYNEAIKGFKDLEQENRTLRANNTELCKQLQTAGKPIDFPSFSGRSYRRYGNTWSQLDVAKSVCQFGPRTEVVRDFKQRSEIKQEECKTNIKPPEGVTKELETLSVSDKDREHHEITSHELKTCAESNANSEESEKFLQGLGSPQATANGSPGIVKNLNRGDSNEDGSNRNKMVRIQITLQRSNSSAQSRPPPVPPKPKRKYSLKSNSS